MLRKLSAILNAARREIVEKLAAEWDPQKRSRLEKIFKWLQRFLVGVEIRRADGATIREGQFYRRLRELADKIVMTAFPEGVREANATLGTAFPVMHKEAILFLSKYNFDYVRGLTEQVRDQLKTQMMLGMINGEPINKVVKRIKGDNTLRGVFDTAEHRLKTFVRTEMSRAYNEGKFFAFRKADVDLVKFAGKATACPMCSPLVGRVFTIEEAPRPPLHLNCVHTLLPIRKVDPFTGKETYLYTQNELNRITRLFYAPGIKATRRTVQHILRRSGRLRHPHTLAYAERDWGELFTSPNAIFELSEDSPWPGCRIFSKKI
ncbi:MAG TPA: hypothetical protein ENG51_03050 [Deltaproteobacteria bacterium]|nr:hypothetical protein [Deltaproteobacteria bacterium]